MQGRIAKRLKEQCVANDSGQAEQLFWYVEQRFWKSQKSVQLESE
jgi:hypothetical protein